MEGYICINGNKTLLTPEQIKELGFCEKPVSVQGLALVRDSLRNGTFLKRFKLRDVIEDFGFCFGIKRIAFAIVDGYDFIRFISVDDTIAI